MNELSGLLAVQLDTVVVDPVNDNGVACCVALQLRIDYAKDATRFHQTDVGLPTAPLRIYGEVSAI